MKHALIVITLFIFFATSSGQDIRIAAASDLQFAFAEISKAFQDQYPDYTLTTSFGSSGNLYSQLEQGAPFDLFFSASADYTKKLEEHNLLEPTTRALYAVGRLVIWVHEQLGLNVEVLKEQVLLDPKVEHIAIANPEHAPYGQAAVDFLKHLNLYDAVQAKLIYGENISQAAQLAYSSAGVGILALSLVLNPTLKDAGSYWLIPLEDHLPLEQEMAILKDQTRPEVLAFYDFMQTDAARDILERYGFILP
jgi:molybdate transport system substrate-binding protein